ncbi:MAG: SufE family protein [Bacteroidota bacterium]|nr:SufE family protein [Bacteroidota bacterium]
MDKNKTIKETEEEIIEAFSWLESWEEKYEYIIELGKKLPELDAKYKVEDNVIKGCQSTVWLVAEFKNDKVFYQADSDAIIVKGLVSMLISVLSGHTPDEILVSKLDFIREIGMMSHLAQTRSNGLVAMVKQIRNYALVFKSVNAKEKILQ